ncbi:MAG: prepilin-type N-terminal cleavage/methylation domain-containing protein [Candidatus Levybacteria bacterium]|nr:prepilin-type N-terminal cleavage/methylation domain-containing protein [Candidatus Levybacteria bacterium]
MKKGFTLIELLVVIVIIGILSALLLANFVGIRQRARDGQRKSDLRQIQAALEMYRADLGNYPTTSILNCNNNTSFGNAPGCTSIYMPKVPTDPIGSGQYVYTYVSSADGLTYSLFACLENVNDAQKETSNNVQYCTGGSTNWSFSLINP